MVEAVGCPRCRRPVPADAPFGTCPACLLLLGLGETPAGLHEGTVAVTVATATVTASGSGLSHPDATLSQVEASEPDNVWPTIPGHAIVRALGKGGGGTVYLAEQLAAGRRRVAVKVLHGTTRTERERMAREAQSLGRLPHPNVVTLYEVGDSSDGPFFTMEFVAGGSLADRLRAGKPAPDETARTVEAVARAVQAAHDQQIRHRDLKPGNVLLEADGTPKVADFGLAKLADTAIEDGTGDRLTHTGQLLGTPSYMAPEQAGRRNSVVDDRTDVYGLGGILYQCLTGRPPFVGQTREETLIQVLTNDPVPPRSIDRTVPPELEAVCLKCLEKDPARRYQTSGEVADELARWQRGEPTRVRPLGRVQHVRRWVGRRSRALAALATLGGLMISAAAAGRFYDRNLQDPVAIEAAELKRIEQELASNGETDLIRAEGSARYTRWLYGALGPSRSKYNDAAFSVVASDLTRVELLPSEVVPPAFRLTAVIRHDSSPFDNSAVGVYFGRWGEELGGGAHLDQGLDVMISDFPPEVGSFLGPLKNRVLMYSSADYSVPGEPVRRFDSVLVACPIMPPAPFNRPRDWRTLVIESRPSGSTCWWMDGQRPAVCSRDPIPAAEIDEGLFRARGTPADGRAGPYVPGRWIRGGIGVVAVRGQIAIQHLKIQNLTNK